jgi:hypothetical protein
MENVWTSHVKLQKFCCILQALHGDISTGFWSYYALPRAPVCYSDTHKAIKRLRPSKSVGIDGIHAFIIKGCSDILMPVLKFIFNLIFSQPILPTLWKQVTIILNFKKRKTTLMNNYRRISVLSTLPKYSKLTYKSTFHTIWGPNLITGCMDSPNPHLQPQTLLLILTHYPLVHSHRQVYVIHCDWATLLILVHMNCFSVNLMILDYFLLMLLGFTVTWLTD